MQNYKRYRDHYKNLLARVSAFHFELGLMKDLQKKCSLIDWRDKVEDLVDKLSRAEKLTLDHVQGILDEGKEKGFLVLEDDKYRLPSASEFEQKEADPSQQLLKSWSEDQMTF